MRDGRFVPASDCMDLADWVHGLARWGQHVMVRAACAAAWCAYRASTGPAALTAIAIHSAEAWLACPCEEHREAWHQSLTLAIWPNGYLSWLPAPDRVDKAIQDAAEATDEPTVRVAVCETLVPWALGLTDE